MVLLILIAATVGSPRRNCVERVKGLVGLRTLHPDTAPFAASVGQDKSGIRPSGGVSKNLTHTMTAPSVRDFGGVRGEQFPTDSATQERGLDGFPEVITCFLGGFWTPGIARNM